MYRAPSRRKSIKKDEGLNLVSILDAIFILIFFLIMSASFIKLYEIHSDVPMISESEPPKEKKDPLHLTLKVTEEKIVLYRGIPSQPFKDFDKNAEGKYPYEEIHQYLITLKTQHLDEKTIIFEPLIDISYEELIKIMDAVRIVRKTDEAIYRKKSDGTDEKVEELFSNIVFGNIQS